jgi:predicted RNase H-like nuclease (RuvC/YqgF family)
LSEFRVGGDKRMKHLDGAKIKSIQTMIAKTQLEIDDLKAQQRSIGESMNKQLSRLQKYEEELQSLKQRSKEIIVSEHAILRYLERVYKLDTNKLYEEIVTVELKNNYAKLGNGSYSIDGCMVKIVDNVIVTVLQKGA